MPSCPAVRRTCRQPRAAPSHTSVSIARRRSRLSTHDGRRDVVREVRDELPRPGRERRQVEPRARRPSGRRRARCRAGAARASRSSSTACTCATRSARNRVRMPSPGPTSSTTSSRAKRGESPDHAEDVLVDQEVLAELLLGRDPHSPNAAAAFSSIRRRDRPRPRRAPRRAPRTCGRRRPARSRSAHRLGSEVRTVGLGEDAVRRDRARRLRGARRRSCT